MDIVTAELVFQELKQQNIPNIVTQQLPLLREPTLHQDSTMISTRTWEAITTNLDRAKKDHDLGEAGRNFIGIGGGIDDI